MGGLIALIITTGLFPFFNGLPSAVAVAPELSEFLFPFLISLKFSVLHSYQ